MEYPKSCCKEDGFGVCGCGGGYCGREAYRAEHIFTKAPAPRNLDARIKELEAEVAALKTQLAQATSVLTEADDAVVQSALQVIDDMRKRRQARLLQPAHEGTERRGGGA